VGTLLRTAEAVGVHGVVLALAVVCAAYNSAAWLKRRQRHLAINAVFYATTVWFESCHVRHHLAECDRAAIQPDSTPVSPVSVSPASVSNVRRSVVELQAVA
jgi:hypothetical protein